MDTKIELSLLRAFIAVAEENNFSRGAKRLATSQSAISVRIRRLEDIIGAKVMNRDRQGLELTPIGRTLLTDAYHLIAEADQMVEKIRAASENRSEKIRFASTQRAMAAVTPDLMSALQDALPDVEILIEALSTPEQIEALQRREIDIGVIQPPHPAFGPGEDIETLAIGREALVIAMAANDPLSKKTRLAWKDLNKRRITLSPIQRQDAALYGELLAHCAKAGFDPEFDTQDIRFRSLMTYLSTRKSLALVPASTACPANTATRPIRDPLFIQFELAWNRRNQTGPIQDILSFVRKNA